MRPDRIQLLAMAGVMLAAIVIGVISWSMIPDSLDSQPGNANNSTPSMITGNDSYVTPDIDGTTSFNGTGPGSESSPTDVLPSYTGELPTSVVKWTDGKAASELKPDGKAAWTQLMESTVSARICYNRLAWDNVFYNNHFASGNIKLQVSWAFTDGSKGDYLRSPDEIGYHGTWAPTSVTWVVTSETWNPRWTLGILHTYTHDFNSQGANTNIHGVHYKTYE